MLYFTRWKALGIILTALVVCLFAVPNFFPEATVKNWPVWAQRRLVLGLDLQGGSYLLLEVDSNYVKKEKLDQVLKLTERYCVVYQTIRNGPPVEISLARG